MQAEMAQAGVWFYIVIVLAYFLGNISPSTLIGRAHGIDIKKEGSGNAGTTNTLRVLGPKAALITLLVDIGKGVAAVLIGQAAVGPYCAMWCAVAAFFGHIWPVLLKFQGGKGVAVAFGVITALHPGLGFTMLGIVILTVLITRRVSFGSIIGAASFPFFCWLMKPEFFWFSVVMGAVVLWKHRSNMVRLAHGEEKPITFDWFRKK